MKRATVDITIYDDETGAVQERLHFPKSSYLGWEVDSWFRRMGERIARKIDPSYEPAPIKRSSNSSTS